MNDSDDNEPGRYMLKREIELENVSKEKRHISEVKQVNATKVCDDKKANGDIKQDKFKLQIDITRTKV